MDSKFKIGFLGYDVMEGNLISLFHEALPYHQDVEKIDWQMFFTLYGVDHKIPCVSEQYILDNINNSLLQKLPLGF